MNWFNNYKNDPCDPSSLEPCSDCKVKDEHLPRGKDRCIAICQATGQRCRRHVYVEHNPKAKTYGKPAIWCFQHQKFCDSHRRWYKNPCDQKGMKRKAYAFMDKFIDEVNYPYHFFTHGNPDDIKWQVDKRFFNAYYDQDPAYRPSQYQLDKAYSDIGFLNFLAKYLLLVRECDYRRQMHNRDCRMGGDREHDLYRQAIARIFKIMEKSIIAEVMINALRSLRMNEVNGVDLDEKAPKEFIRTLRQR